MVPFYEDWRNVDRNDRNDRNGAKKKNLASEILCGVIGGSKYSNQN
jgi:hypothetical protein